MNDYVLAIDDPRAGQLRLTGGKAAGLAQLSTIAGLHVPPGFSVTTCAYAKFVKQNGLAAEVQRDTDPARVRSAVLQSELPPDVQSAIGKAYQDLCRRTQQSAVAVRSSATAEDLEGRSFAGVHKTCLNVTGEREVMGAVRECYASLFTDGAVNYRRKAGIDDATVQMGVVIQQMVRPRVSGIAFNVDQSTAYLGTVVEASYGLGEAIVANRTSPDRFVLREGTHEMIMLERGSKETKVIYGESHGTRTVDTDAGERERLCLSFAEVKQVADAVDRVAAAFRRTHAYEYMDTEFVFDESGELFFVQARPATLDLSVIAVADEAARTATTIHRGGTRITQKACHGILRIIPSFADVQTGDVAVRPGDLVVTQLTWNEWTEYLRGMAGIIAQEGGTLSHPAILSREWAVACMVGSENAIANLSPYNGSCVTFDANRCAVFLGELPLTEKRVDPVEVSKPVEFREVKRKKSSDIFMTDEDGCWLGRPKYALGRLQLDLYEQAFDLLADWLDTAPEIRKIKDDILYTKSGQGVSLTQRFTAMSVGELEEVLAKIESTERQYLRASQNLRLTVESVNEFVELYLWINTFMNMNYCYNSVLQKKLRQKATQCRMPAAYFDDSLSRVENTLAHEDAQREVEGFQIAADLKQYDMSDPLRLLPVLRTDDPNLFARIDAYSKAYRFQRADLRRDPPHGRVIERLAGFTRDGIHPPSAGVVQNRTAYFPEHREFQQILELAARAKIKGNNLHHVKVRGQWHFRDLLLRIGDRLTQGGCLPKREDVFEMRFEAVLHAMVSLGLDAKGRIVEREQVG